MAEFYKVDRAVRTASVAQVRSGIYSTSTKKWLRYANGLDEFLTALDESVLSLWEDGVGESLLVAVMAFIAKDD